MFKVGTRVVYISKYKTKKILHVVDKCVGRTCIRVSNIARKETFLQHQSLFRKATDEEIAAGHRIESCKCVVTRTYQNGTCNKCGMQDMGEGKDE